MNRSRVLAGSVLFSILMSVVTLATLADVGPGVLYDVQYPDGTSVPEVFGGAGQTFFIVVPGRSYRAIITNVEQGLWGQYISVWIKGKNQDGTSWQVKLENQLVDSGTITTGVFRIPLTAGCTIQVAYYEPGKETANPTGPGTGHMKTFGDDEEPFDNPVPCGGEVVPEFPFPPEAIAALGLIAWTAVRRRRKL